MKTILLTGASGYLGRSLVKELLRDNYNLILLIRNKSNVEYLNDLEGSYKIYVIGETPLNEVFLNHNVDVILHTSANYGRKGENLSKIVSSNLSFPLEILTLAVQFGVKYFINTDTALPKSLNWYAKSKKQFLEWLQDCSTQINVINVELQYFFGPNDDSSKFISFLIKEFNSGKSSIDFTEATPFRDFIFIDDVVQAYRLLLAELNRFSGFNTVGLGSGKAEQLKEIILTVRRLIKQEEVLLNFGALEMRENEVMNSCADITLLKNMGWKPMYTFEEAILHTIQIESIK